MPKVTQAATIIEYCTIGLSEYGIREFLRLARILSLLNTRRPPFEFSFELISF